MAYFHVTLLLVELMVHFCYTDCNLTRADCVEVAGYDFYGVTDIWTEARYPGWMIHLTGLYSIVVLALSMKQLFPTFAKLFPHMVLGDEVCRLIKEPAESDSLFDKPKGHSYHLLVVDKHHNWKMNTNHPEGVYLLLEQSELPWLNNPERKPEIQLRDKRGVRIADLGPLAWILSGRKHGIEISANDFKRKFKYLCLLPSNFSSSSTAGKFFIRLSLPLIALLTFWKLFVDIVDVGLDVQYARALDNGAFISYNITRNTIVNDMILTFGIIGVVKFVFFAFGTDMILSCSKKDKAKKILLEPIVSCIKIIFEDLAELFLEYFYVEMYSLSGNDNVMTIIFKVGLTVLIHGISGFKMLFNFKKNYKKAKASKDKMIGIKIPYAIKCCIPGAPTFDKKVKISSRLIIMYLVCTLIKIFFSFIVIIRLVGVIYRQRFTGHVAESCFAVKDGKLLQTPFEWDCMNDIDRTIFVLYCFPILFVMLVPIVLLFKQAILPCFKQVRSKFNGTRFHIYDRPDVYFGKVASEDKDIAQDSEILNDGRYYLSKKKNRGNFSVNDKDRFPEKFKYEQGKKHYVESLFKYEQAQKHYVESTIVYVETKV